MVQKSKCMIIIRRIMSIILILAGIFLLMYPFAADWFDRVKQADLITEYEECVDNMSKDSRQTMKKDAENYNKDIYNGKVTASEYQDALSVKGFMCYIDIPKINVYLPVYHGTSDYVLSKGIGHIENTSLPYGGESSHCVLTGHTGLSESSLFTNLPKLEKGDMFYIHVLDEIHAYEVDKIDTVLPYEADGLGISSGEDYITLVTCTPFGINSHRLLVRGHRVLSKDSKINDEQDVASQQKPISIREYIDYTKNHGILLLAIGISLVMIAVALLIIVIRKRKFNKMGGSP